MMQQFGFMNQQSGTFGSFELNKANSVDTPIVAKPKATKKVNACFLSFLFSHSFILIFSFISFLFSISFKIF